MPTLLDTLPQLERELTEAERDANAARRRVVALRQIVEGVKALNGHASGIALPSREAQQALIETEAREPRISASNCV